MFEKELFQKASDAIAAAIALAEQGEEGDEQVCGQRVEQPIEKSTAQVSVS